MSDSDSKGLHTVEPAHCKMEVPKKVRSNLTEICRWFDAQYHQDIYARDVVLNVLVETFIQNHSEDFDNKGEGLYVYTGPAEATEKDISDEYDDMGVDDVELDCGDSVASVGEPTEESDESEDEKITFSLHDGPGGQ